MASESLRVCEVLEEGPYRSARSLLSRLSLLLLSAWLFRASLLLSLPSLWAPGLAPDSLLGGRTVWLSQWVGVGVCCDLVDWSLALTDRTMLLSFSTRKAGYQLSGIAWEGRTSCEILTNIQHITSSTCI